MAYSGKAAQSFESALDAEDPIVIDPEEAATVAGCSRAEAGQKRQKHYGVAGVAGVAGVHQEKDQTPLLPEPDEPTKFPSEVLNGLFGTSTRAVHNATQAPLAMCAASVLAMAAVAVQGHRDVELPGAGRRPISLYLLSIAESGERKSSADRRVKAALELRQLELNEQYKSDLTSYARDKAAYESAKAEAIKSAKTYAAKKAALEALGPEPESPINAQLT